MEKAPFLAGQCLFTDNILKEIDEYKLLFVKVSRSGHLPSRHSFFSSQLCFKNAKGQKYLLNVLEVIIGHNPEIRAKIFNKKSVSKILLKFYDDDIIEEESFYTWHEKASKRYSDKNTSKEIREMANEFIQWLRTAEESSDEDDDDDNEKLPEPVVRLPLDAYKIHLILPL